jgi:CHAT domain-containing protein
MLKSTFCFGVSLLLVGTGPTISSSNELINADFTQAQTLNRQGVRQLETGQTEAALATWKRAEMAYMAAGDETGQLGSQLNQVQALQTLGQYRSAKNLLDQISTRLRSLPDSLLKASSLRSLGITLLRVGDLQESYQVLQSSLQMSQRLNGETGSTLLALGNVVRAQQRRARAVKTANADMSPFANANAIALYQQAAATTQDNLIRLQASLNQFSFLVENQQLLPAASLVNDIETLLNQLPPSRATIYAQVNFAESLMKADFEATQQTKLLHPSAIAQLLANAVQQARRLNDLRAEAYALGQLGHLYETSQQWAEAEALTRAALQIAQAMQADDVAVSWQWQLGRILNQQGRTSAAIVAYNQAVEALSVLRGDLVAINPEVQFSFRDQVEPIYRQLVQLLLDDNPTQVALTQARLVIEALQLAELNNFFREACLDTKPQQIDQVDANAAVIYSIILPDRLAVILSLPAQPLRYHFTKLRPSSDRAANQPTQAVDQVFDDFFATLNPFVTSQNPLRPQQQLYDWLIRPIAADIGKSEIKTLVFVMDGVLQGVPLAALHDGQQYLIENYSLALTPGLQLLPPRSLPSRQFKTLAGGLSESRQGFSALPGVAQELQEIAAIVPTSILLNQTFSQSQLAQKLDSDSFPIVHLATHGQFSSDADQTFLLTWDGKLKLEDLNQLLELNTTSRQSGSTHQPIELLILSACQTAVGDKRAALGLAGVAIRSGARSTIATLWSVQDNSTAELITQFYNHLKQPGMTRAEALRQAQLSLLRSPDYQHPYYWAPFVLVGNWQ